MENYGQQRISVNNLQNWTICSIIIELWSQFWSLFRFSANGGKSYSAEELIKAGPKNILIGDCEYYAASKLDHHSSFRIFKKTFTERFPWECIEVYSPPPKVAFKWRHVMQYIHYY